MSNGSSLVTAPVAAEHGDRCACRHCASGAYIKLQQTADYRLHEITRLTAELKAARARSHFRTPSG
jgi:hypothetical protein